MAARCLLLALATIKATADKAGPFGLAKNPPLGDTMITAKIAIRIKRGCAYAFVLCFRCDEPLPKLISAPSFVRVEILELLPWVSDARKNGNSHGKNGAAHPRSWRSEKKLGRYWLHPGRSRRQLAGIARNAFCGEQAFASLQCSIYVLCCSCATV